MADRIANDVMEVLGYGEESVSVGFEEVSSQDWAAKVYRPDIQSQPENIYKKPGYTI